MRPRTPAAALAQDDLFRSRLDVIIDLRHPLVRLAKAIDWSVFDEAFDPLFDDKNGAPCRPGSWLGCT
jgi:IS5 family transposase